MKTKQKDAILIVVLIAFFLWMTLISICIVDLYAIQGPLVELVLALKDSVSDLQNYIIDSLARVWL